MSWSKESELKEQRPIYDPCLNGQAYENQGHWDKIISGEATPLRNKLLCQLFRAISLLWISAKMKVWHPWPLKKIKILGAVLELPAK